MSEVRNILDLRAESVDLKRLGVDSTWIHPMALELRSVSMPDSSGYKDMVIYNHDKLSRYGGYDWLKRVLMAQSLVDNISNTEGGLSIRWAEPFDFTDGDGKKITHHDWMIPAHGKTFEPYSFQKSGPIQPRYKDPKNPTEDENRRYKSYLVSHEKLGLPKYNRQTVFENLPGPGRYCMLLWGVGRGYNSSGTVQTVLIKRAHLKTIEMVSISQLEKGKVAVMQHPCLFKRSDDCAIDVCFPEHYQGRDEIVLYGWICEGLGAEQTG